MLYTFGYDSYKLLLHYSNNNYGNIFGNYPLALIDQLFAVF